VTLNLPDGWTANPADQTVKFTREDESQTVRFAVRPAANAAPGEYQVTAAVSSDGQTYSRGYQVIEYPHIRRQHIYDAARTTTKVIDVKVASGLTVGYIAGVGDQVPPAIEQLGVKVEMIGPDDLAWGNLSRFQTIVTGVRAYERRADLRANNSRLLDYVHDGGTLIVQYNKFEFNAAQYGPYPAKVTTDRVTDEHAPVKVVAPNDPIFNVPNKLTAAAWDNWVQERGLYFLADHDSRYRDLVSLEDPFPNNAGEKSGALVAAPFGKGRWVYVGLGLWRELPAGVDGAYQLLANLISIGHS
jgi:alpha-galactosidase-like protein